jgi:hypothetical protein
MFQTKKENIMPRRRIQSNDVSTSSTVYRLVAPNRIQHTPPSSSTTNPHHPVTNAVPTFNIFKSNLLHFSRRSQVPRSQWASFSQYEITLVPGTYISNAPGFTLSPLHYFVAILCHVPCKDHGSRPCFLLKGSSTPLDQNICLLITNISQLISVHIPANCDVFSFVNNPLLQMVVCHITSDSLPTFVKIN